MTVQDLIAELKKLPPQEDVTMHLSGKKYAFVTSVNAPTKKMPWVNLDWEEEKNPE